MAKLTASDIVTLHPTSADIDDAVRYAIKSGASYTYNRMGKIETWKRVARIARGKVNENLIRRFAESLGITAVTEDKSYRQSDTFDFVFASKGRHLDADVKTFHVLSQFIRLPRKLFCIADLFSDTDHTSQKWHMFLPMLVPQDQKRRPKEIYIFAISVEDKINLQATSTLTYPWCSFPDDKDEAFLTDANMIRDRERSGSTLSVTVSWPQDMPGTGTVIYEMKNQANQAVISPKSNDSLTREAISSLLALQIDDAAHAWLRTSRRQITITAQENNQSIGTFAFFASRFREIFPRQDFTLFLIGWISRETFNRISRALPDGAPCYFYPPRKNRRDKHEPGTKTVNRYVLPGELQPITTLTEG